ncbi:hypothetical protein [Rossellomorea marisflavi]|uniref:hypothetical protein n=1 Tax=Rossellomorea marisflavi TaxID=189381 RepID=UPI003F9FFD1F
MKKRPVESFLKKGWILTLLTAVFGVIVSATSIGAVLLIIVFIYSTLLFTSMVYTYYLVSFLYAMQTQLKAKQSIPFVFDIKPGDDGYKKEREFRRIFCLSPIDIYDRELEIHYGNINDIVTIAKEFESYWELEQVRISLPDNRKMSEEEKAKKVQLHVHLTNLRTKLVESSPILHDACFDTSKTYVNKEEEKALKKLRETNLGNKAEISSEPVVDPTLHDLQSIIESNAVTEETRMRAEQLKSLIESDTPLGDVEFSVEEEAKMKIKAVEMYHSRIHKEKG